MGKKVIIEKDERYPDYSLSDYYSYGSSKVYLPDADVKYIKYVQKLYEDAQDMLEKAYKRGKLYDPS